MAVRWEGSRVKANTCVLLTINNGRNWARLLQGINASSAPNSSLYREDTEAFSA